MSPPPPPRLPPLQVTLAWQFTQHVHAFKSKKKKKKKQDKEWTNATIGLLTSEQLSTNPSVSLSAHHASSLAPIHNLPSGTSSTL